MGPEPPRGHRSLPHTADVIVEAWGPDDLACAEEAAAALIEMCVTGEADPAAGSWICEIGALPTDLVRTVLDEVVFALDTSEPVPVSAQLDRTAGAGVALRLGLADRQSVTFTGAVPKAIVMTMSEPAGPGAPSRCRFIVDV